MRAVILFFLLLTVVSFTLISCEGGTGNLTAVGLTKEQKQKKREARRKRKKERIKRKEERSKRKEAKKGFIASVGNWTQVVSETQVITDLIAPKLDTDPPMESSCSFPAIKVSGDKLLVNDNSGREFFFAGMVDNIPSVGNQLTTYDHDEMEQIMKDSKAIGANAMRWNAFLKGADFVWNAEGHVIGLRPGCINALVDGLNLAKQYGILVQIVLSTSHFLRYGTGGERGYMVGGGIKVSNKKRVDNNYKMFTTASGTKAYIDNVIKPMTAAIGNHCALFGYVVMNEGHGIAKLEGSPHTIWSDRQIHYRELITWVNKVSGEIKRQQPGVILSASIIARLAKWWEDDNLKAIGGDADGTLDIFQYQYYPEKYKWDISPFYLSASLMSRVWGISNNKPSIVGEFPIEGWEELGKSTDPTSLLEAYQWLKRGGYCGGFNWRYQFYSQMSYGEKEKVRQAYKYVKDDVLKGLTLWG